MRITGTEIEEKKLSFESPIVTSQKVLRKRDVIIFKIFNDEGNCGIGGAFPLPPFTEPKKSVISEWKKIKKNLFDFEFDNLHDFKAFLESNNLHSPILHFALETAVMNLFIDASKINELQFINKIKSKPIKINALISETNMSDFIGEAESAVNDGFDTIKIKLGYSAFENELIRLGFLSTISKNIKIRVDVNGAWSFEEAEKKLERILQFNIEYVEDPTNSFDDNLRLAQLFHNKIAFDNTATSIDRMTSVAKENAVLILKPAFFGSILSAVRLIESFNSENSKLIISSSFETAIGREINFALASLLPEGVVHGLKTQNSLVESSPQIYERLGNRILFSVSTFLRRNKCSEIE